MLTTESTKIYIVTNCYGNINDVYVGKTKNSRKNDHKFHFGSQIEYSEIDEIFSLNKTDWKPLETYWINQFKAWGFNVLNENEGGGGPTYHKESSKKLIGEKVSKKLKGRVSPMKNKQHTEQTKKLQSEANKGKLKGRISPRKDIILSKETLEKMNKKVAQISPQTNNIIKIWGSIKQAMIDLNAKGISNVITGRSKTCVGFYWKLIK
jgi:hypothetical protein